MGSIREKSFSKKWIIQKSREYRYDPTLVEKVIYAFELIGSLIDEGINLVFKGGTSLLLLLPEYFKRLSIDVDIILTDENLNLSALFDKILTESAFIKWEENIREKAKDVHFKHFKFYYNSCINNREEPILMDVLFLKELPYPEIVNRPIVLDFFEINKDIVVKIPSIECLFADKLTAFAPNTIGIPWGRGKSMEIIKQLFDLGILFYYMKDIEKTRIGYENVAKIEAKFRGSKKPHSVFLEDSFETAFLVCQLDFRNSISNEKTMELKNGVRRVRNFVSQGKYNLLNAKEDASQVAFISHILKDGIKISMKNVLNVLESIKSENVREITLSDRFEVLNRLKRISPESFYLWAMIDGKVNYE